MGRPRVLVIDGKKPCSRCKQNLPVAQFRVMLSSASGLTPACVECMDFEPPVGNQTPGRRPAKDSVLWTKYGIRQEDYDRMYEEQEGRCRICSTHHDILCVDHSHITKKVRGLLCRECNFGLGKFADDLNRLLAAAAYLMESESND